jgi:hypothetical protein
MENQNQFEYQNNNIPPQVSNKNNTLSIVVTVCITLLILFFGYLYFTKNNTNNINLTLGDVNTVGLVEKSADFDGVYMVTAEPINKSSCAPATATVEVRQGDMSGTLVTTTGVQASISAVVNGKGEITTGNTTNSVSFTGLIDDENGSGSWVDVFGCQGTF